MSENQGTFRKQRGEEKSRHSSVGYRRTAAGSIGPAFCLPARTYRQTDFPAVQRRHGHDTGSIELAKNIGYRDSSQRTKKVLLERGECVSQLACHEKFWHRSAPRKVVATHQGQDTAASWDLWQRHLATRKSPALPNILRTKSPFLLWGLPPKAAAEVAEWLSAAPFTTNQEIADRVIEYLQEGFIDPVVGKPNLPHSLECVGLAYALPGLATYLTSSQWWELCHYLWVTAEKATLCPPDDAMATLAVQLAGGELPLVLAYGIPEFKPLRKLRKSGWELLSKSLVELLDGEGLPKASYLPALRGLLACWARCKLLGEQFTKGGFSDAADIQFGWLVRQAVRLSRTNGTAILSDIDDCQWSPEFFKVALETGGDDSDCAAADALLPSGPVPADADFDDDDLPEPSLNSDWSGLAVLAPGWTRDVPATDGNLRREPAPNRTGMWPPFALVWNLGV